MKCLRCNKLMAPIEWAQDGKPVAFQCASSLCIETNEYCDELRSKIKKLTAALNEILAMKPDPYGDRWEEGYEAAVDECKDIARAAIKATNTN